MVYNPLYFLDKLSHQFEIKKNLVHELLTLNKTKQKLSFYRFCRIAVYKMEDFESFKKKKSTRAEHMDTLWNFKEIRILASLSKMSFFWWL